MFFVRSIFWLGVVFVLLPVAPEDKDKIEAISPIEAVGAAAAAVRDISGFCSRNPATCDTGGKAAVALGYKAKYGAQQLLASSVEQNVDQKTALAPISMPQSTEELSETNASDLLSDVASSATHLLGNPGPAEAPDTEEPIVSVEAVVPVAATPTTPTPRARPNI